MKEILKNLVNDITNQFPNIKNEKLNLSINSELNNEERSIQYIIFEYAKNFNNQKTKKDKYGLIMKKFINYLNFFEKNYNDTSSEKYLYLLEKLFKLYTYYFITSLRNCISLEEKKKIKENIELFLKKINIKVSFRIKQLLNHFKTIKVDHFIEVLEIIAFSMKLLYNKDIDNFNIVKGNNFFILWK